MRKAPVLVSIERRKKVAGILRKCLSPFGLQEEVEEIELQIGDQVIVENTGNHGRISSAILNTMFPFEPAPCDLFHYTSLSNLHHIASSNELRLYSVRKRLGQGELESFAKAHHLTGYLDSSHGRPYIEELSNDLFYVALTRVPPRDPDYMWGYFAEHTGARLQLRIAPSSAELRVIQYGPSSPRTLLNDINDSLVGDGEPPFLPWTISRLGAFYLPSSLHIEDEVRLLIKRHQGGRDRTRNDGQFDYWPVSIGLNNAVGRIDIVGIHAAPNANRADIDAAIAGTAFAGIPVTGP